MPSTCVSWLQAYVGTLVDKCALRYFYFLVLFLSLCYGLFTGFMERGRRNCAQFVSRYGWQAVFMCKRWVKNVHAGAFNEH